MKESEETVYYTDDQGVKITSVRLIVGSSTYPMSGITSIKITKIPPQRLWAIFFIVTVVLSPIGILMLIFMKGKYALRISTAGGEANVIESRDKEYIEKIAMAMNEAVIQRG